ncbi:hypothetical protein NKG05_09475 [Oerskovia sp. M15]
MVAFQLMTSPVAAHMVGRAGYRTGKVRSDLLALDDLTADQDAADERRWRRTARRPRAPRVTGLTAEGDGLGRRG